MAKGQLRGNKEARKPKADKKGVAPAKGSVGAAFTPKPPASPKKGK